MSVQSIVFSIAAFLVIASATMVVLNRHPIYSALFLILTFVGQSIFFLQLQAPFLAAVQVIVYAGAIMVLFVFVIMLLGEDKPLAGEQRLRIPAAGGVVLCLLLIGGIGYAATHSSGEALSPAPPQVALVGTVEQAQNPQMVDFGSVQAIGNTLFTDYLFAFEATSIVLLVAMIGVVVLAKRRL